MSKVELETTEGVMLSVDEYNKLTEDSRRMVQAATRCAHAYGVIRHLCGGDFRDFNNLDKWLDGDPEFAFLDEKLAPGIAIVVSEKDKDWVCPIAHNEHHMTLGAFMQKVMDDWLEAHRPIDLYAEKEKP